MLVLVFLVRTSGTLWTQSWTDQAKFSVLQQNRIIYSNSIYNADLSEAAKCSKSSVIMARFVKTAIATSFKHNPFVKDIISITRRNYALRCLWNFSHHGWKIKEYLLIIFRGMIFSTITLSGNVISILLYRTKHQILYFLPFLSYASLMVRGVSKGK